MYLAGDKLVRGDVVKLKVEGEEFHLLSSHAAVVQTYIDKGKFADAKAVARANALKPVEANSPAPRTESAPLTTASKGMVSTKTLETRLEGKADDRKKP